MNNLNLMDRLWTAYSNENPSAGKIMELFRNMGEIPANDHVAFRTFDDKRIGINVLARAFEDLGYREAGSYEFPDKHLEARHYEIKDRPDAPRIFISQLIRSAFSRELQEVIAEWIDAIPSKYLEPGRLILAGNVSGLPSFDVYNRLRSESEYAAWVYVFGFRVNHFTISVNSLKQLNNLEKVNELLKSKGYKLNSSGGEIKGTEAELLRQSSTLADQVEIRFTEGTKTIPSCYYEFAQRYPDGSGNLYSGFIAASANKIFESTDFREKAG